MGWQQGDSLDWPRRRTRLVALLVLLLNATPGLYAADEPKNMATARSAYFTEAVLPLLKKHCCPCHSHDAEAAEGGLVLDSQSGWKVGGDSGPAIVPGRPHESLLLTAVSYTDTELQMPPDGRLPERDIDILEKWIADGAYDSRIAEPGRSVDTNTFDVLTRKLWSLQPVKPIVVPHVGTDHWVRNDIDRFILARLRQHGISPNDAADRHALLRRATFDLTGLPPSLDEISAFVDDNRPDARDRLVERLLQSPHYGERWGRHWLDLARYSDSNGGDINYAHANAWRYRDYVIRSFNVDKRYDVFIREQLAGDLMTEHEDEERRRQLLTATGFLMLGPKMLAEVDTDKLLIDIVDEQLDVTGQTFLGMTFGCARCHDHKFDPVTTQDYYAMAGIFRSTQVIDVLRPENGVSEWLEVDVTSVATRAAIAESNRKKKRLQQQLSDLGGATSSTTSSANAASQAIVVRKLPSVSSTTWAAWVRIVAPQVLGAVISATYEGADQGHSLGFDRGRTPRIVWNHGSGPHTIIQAAEPVSFGEWHQIALTFDADSRRLELFVDGFVAATATNVATSAFDTISVGRREASQQWQFIGDVDEVKIYDLVLNSAQMRSLATRNRDQSFPGLTTTQNLPTSVLHWNFDQTGVRTRIDAQSGGPAGVLIGTSADKGIVKDGAVGAAFSFHGLKEDTKLNAEQTRRIAKLRLQIQQLEDTSLQATRVMAAAATTPVNLPVHIRGSHLKLAEIPIERSTPLAFKQALKPIDVPPQQNGRLQLANWIASPQNPLTARVMVNRVWQHHFGTGLVRTPSNFGLRGEQPSHPELLDWLASEFVANNWSIKHLHKLIMNSATYSASSQFNASAARHDPDNRLHGKYSIRRLEAEAIRDSLLVVSGRLDRTVGGTLFTPANKKRVTMSPDDAVYKVFRRSVYLPSVRVRSYEMFSIFDVSNNGQHVAKRPQTMVAQQALFLMNNPLVLAQAQTLAEHVSQQLRDFDLQVDWLHRTLYGRPARSAEVSTLVAAFENLTDSASSQKDADRSDRTAAWQHLIHTMICANEFIHIQ